MNVQNWKCKSIYLRNCTFFNARLWLFLSSPKVCVAKSYGGVLSGNELARNGYLAGKAPVFGGRSRRYHIAMQRRFSKGLSERLLIRSM